MLKPCPFCGNTNIYLNGGEHVGYDKRPYWYVHCYECGADAMGNENKEQAVQNWNRRVDVRPVVLCRDCKHYNADYELKCVHIFGLAEPDEDDFCSFGERREDTP